MLKTISRMWMTGLARAGRTSQKQTAKLLKTLLGKPAAKPTRALRAVPRIKPALKPLTKSVIKPLLKSVAAPLTSVTPRPKRISVPKLAKQAKFKAMPAASLTALLGLAAPPKTLPKVLPLATKKPRSAIQAGGKWMASLYSPTTDAGIVMAKRMAYYLYVPSPRLSLVTPAQPAPQPLGMPLIVMLHGCEQSATQFAEGTRMNLWAEKKGYVVLYPQQSVRAHANRCWKWYDEETQNGQGDVPMILGMIEKVAAKYPIDRSRVYVGGLSAGAAMAHILALNYPESFAAVGLHSAPVFGAGHSRMGAYGVMQQGASMRASGAIKELLNKHSDYPTMPTVLIHGTADHVVRPVNQTQLVQQSLQLNRITERSARPSVIKTSGRSRLSARRYELTDFYHGKKLLIRTAQINELAHAWSGGDAAVAFNSAEGPDASKMMIEFFARHRRV